MLVDNISLEGSSMQTSLGVVRKCPAHGHIRDCVLEEMDRAITADHTRFPSTMAIFLQTTRRGVLEALRRNLPREQAFGPAGTPAYRHEHDPRIRQLAERFVDMRRRLPLHRDLGGWTYIDSRQECFRTLDSVESLRLVINARDSAWLEREHLRISPLNTNLLMQGSVNYLRALQIFNQKAANAGLRFALHDGLRPCILAGHRVGRFALRVLGDHLEERAVSRRLTEEIAWCTWQYDDLLHALEQPPYDRDVFIEAAVIAHVRYVQASCSTLFPSVFRLHDVPLESLLHRYTALLSDEEAAAMTLDEARTHAVRCWVELRNHLGRIHEECHALRARFNVEFQAQPFRNADGSVDISAGAATSERHRILLTLLKHDAERNGLIAELERVFAVLLADMDDESDVDGDVDDVDDDDDDYGSSTDENEVWNVEEATAIAVATGVAGEGPPPYLSEQAPRTISEDDVARCIHAHYKADN